VKELRIINVDRKSRGMNHSNHYHKYFAGYAEYSVGHKTNINGRVKMKIKRVYADDYYAVHGTQSSWLKLRGLHILLFLLSLGLFIFCTSRPVGSMVTKYVGFFVFAAAVAYFWLFWVLAFFVTTHKLMTQYEYRQGSVRLMKSALIGSAVIASPAAGVVLYSVLNMSAVTVGDLLCAVGILASAAIVWAMYKIEKRVPYKRVKNNAQYPSNSVIIQWDRQHDDMKGNVIESE